MALFFIFSDLDKQILPMYNLSILTKEFEMAKTNDLSRKQALKIEKCDKRINTVVFVFALIFFSLFTLVLKDYFFAFDFILHL